MQHGRESGPRGCKCRVYGEAAYEDAANSYEGVGAPPRATPWRRAHSWRSTGASGVPTVGNRGPQRRTRGKGR